MQVGCVIHRHLHRPFRVVRYDSGMIRIPLGEDLEALIDDVDELLVAGFRWRPLRLSNGLTYAHAWNGHQHYYMHRLVSGASSVQRVDHEDRNALNNQRRNLRIATPSENGANRIPDRRRSKTSQYKGVYWDKSKKKWGATIHINGKTKALGRFHSEDLAARAYDNAATQAWGRFALTNFPKDG